MFGSFVSARESRELHHDYAMGDADVPPPPSLPSRGRTLATMTLVALAVAGILLRLYPWIS